MRPRPADHISLRRRRRRLLVAAALAVLIVAGVAVAGTANAQADGRRWWQFPGRTPTRVFEAQRLDGSGNNLAHPTWGQADQSYLRLAPARYADGRGEPVTGPNARYVSNRIFNDVHQNVFSQRVTQWAWTWGQFVDHTIGLRAEPPKGDQAGVRNIPFDAADPLESFSNTLGMIPFSRSGAAPGTGVANTREQVNTVSSYLDAWAVYGGSEQRLEWLREGPVDGDLRNNGAKLLMPDGLLPRADSRGDAAAAPTMSIDGRLLGQPSRAVVAGDQRANENIALTATQTLFALEHNRIVSLLPAGLSEEQKFQIARRVVIAEQQYITYQEFLPAMGIRLPRYRGYNPAVNPTLTNEFATVGYRGHSQIHGELEMEAEADRYTAGQLEALQRQGVEAETSEDGEEIEFTVPLNVAFHNPDLIPMIGLGPVLHGIGMEAQYRNDEMIDNQLRSVLFQIPVSGNPQCLDGKDLPACFSGVVDLGALDVERGRDHGMPTYNGLRRAYGLAPVTSFRAVTGEETESFPTGDTQLVGGAEINDPDSLDFVRLLDPAGNLIEAGSEAASTSVVTAVRRTPLAARLKAVYGSVDKLDAFVGMVSERHVPGTEFGELQLAIWKRQFQALRDGDRFFYGNDPGLASIRQRYGIDHRQTLAQVIVHNTDVDPKDLGTNVFLLGGQADPPGADATAPAPSAPEPSGLEPSGTAPSAPGSPAGPSASVTPARSGDRDPGLPAATAPTAPTRRTRSRTAPTRRRPRPLT